MSTARGRLLIETTAHSGSWNMAYDGALLDAALERDETILRIYRWSSPTLSVGHFQKQLAPELPTVLRDLPRVRRLSGGGAILHHHEWTYSVCVPPSHPLASRGTILYETIHNQLIRAFQDLGVSAHMRGDASTDENFLCFLRGDPRDIVVHNKKIVGSAQRRRRGAVLQHGSVLLRGSELTPEILGIAELQNLRQIHDFFGCEEFISHVTPQLFSTEPIRTHAPTDHSNALKIGNSTMVPIKETDDEIQERLYRRINPN